jgi:hypothetical protein
VAGPKPIFPNDSIQSLVGGWWVEDRDKPALCRGRLLWAFVPFVDQEPPLTAEGRVEATDHRRALYKIEPLRVSQQRSAPKLPVAASPEFLARSRLSTAPSYARCGESTEPVDPSLTKGMAKWQAAQTVLVAPYFGITGGATRGGFNQVFVERIQRAEYPEYVWDLLPIGGSPDGSVLMLKQLQPIGRHYNAYELTPFRLSADALAVMDDWVAWLLTGNLKPDGVLAMFREGVAALG